MHKYSLSLCAILFLMLASITSSAQSFDAYYERIETPQPTLTENKIEVLEFFWYGCPHCYTFEPYLQEWLKTMPDNVEFRRLPGILNNNWIPHAKAYYTAVILGVGDRIHPLLFDAIHKEQQRIFDEDSIKIFFIEQGIDGDEFSRTFDSMEVRTQVKQAYDMAELYRISGVPSIIVNGKYRTSPALAQSYEKILEVMNHLIEKESAGLQ